jgi:hypothetical protein
LSQSGGQWPPGQPHHAAGEIIDNALSAAGPAMFPSDHRISITVSVIAPAADAASASAGDSKSAESKGLGTTLVIADNGVGMDETGVKKLVSFYHSENELLVGSSSPSVRARV